MLLLHRRAAAPPRGRPGHGNRAAGAAAAAAPAPLVVARRGHQPQQQGRTLRPRVATTMTTVTTKPPEALSPADLANLPPPGKDDRAATTAPSPAPASSSSSSSSSADFDFERTWYPLALLETLKTDRPNGLTLMGKGVVVWRPLTAGPQRAPPAGNAALETDAAGVRRRVTRRVADGSWDDPDADGWVVQSDVCPHRLAPLSEGRLEGDGTVQCSYHGWRFDAGGALTLIPQLEQADAAAHARACSHPRSAVAVHPARAFMGVLWVWGEAGGADVALRAATTPPTCVPRAMMPPPPPAAKGEAPAWRRLRPAGAAFYSRDVPVAQDVLLENFVDPAHVPISHHRVIGDRDADQTMEMRLVAPEAARRGGVGGVYLPQGVAPPPPSPSSSPAPPPPPSGPISRDGGYSLEVRPAGMPAYNLHFRPPGHAWFYFPPPPPRHAAEPAPAAPAAPPSEEQDRVSMLLYATPTKPGWCRVFVSMVSPEGLAASTPPTASLPPVVQAFVALLDKAPALQHALNRNAILDGDDLFLAAQQRQLYASDEDDHASWRDKYYLPTSTDVGVAALRRWIDVYGKKMPFLGAPVPEMSREATFDRYTQHTKDCPHCSAALRNCERALWALGVLAAACAGAALFGAAAAAFRLVAEPARAWAVSAGAVAVAAACALAARAVWALRGLFVYHDYQHAEH